MNIKRAGAQPSGKGPDEYFTGAVSFDTMFKSDYKSLGLCESFTC